MGVPSLGPGLAIAGAGLNAYGDVLKGQGVKAGDEFKASMLEQSAQRGEAAAVEVGAEYSRKLAMDLGNIDAIRGAMHTDPTSPAGAAIRDFHEEAGLTQKAIAVDNITAQARQQQAEAAYLRQAGQQALLASYVGAGADILGGVGKGLSSPGFGVG
jgi:hypothetical protein